MSADAIHTPEGAPGTQRSVDWLTVAAAIGAALNAGVFFSWSTMVMPAIAELPTSEGIGAMQVLNDAAPAPYSLLAFPSALLCVVAIKRGVTGLKSTRGKCMLAGGVLFLVTALALTFFGNVPVSASIDQLNPSTSGAGQWRDLQSEWTWLNHLRAVGSTAAAALLAFAVYSARRAAQTRPYQQVPFMP